MSSYQKAVDQLSRSSLFGGLSERSRSALARISTIRKSNRNGILFWQGEPGSAVFLLIEGRVQLFQTTADGKEVVIRIIEPGEVFAEVVLFERSDYPVTARCLHESRSLVMPKGQIHALLAEETFRNDFVGMLLAKQRFLVDRIRYLSAHGVEERFFHFLSNQYGELEVIQPGLTKRELAAAIDTSPETLSRLLLRLRRACGVAWEGDRLEVPAAAWDRWRG